MTKNDTNKQNTIEEQVEASEEINEDSSDEIEESKAEGLNWEEVARSWEEKYKRALADYQNLEKRSLEQRREWIRSSNRELLLRILPVLDTLLLAKEHSDDKSLHVSAQQFLDILKAEGITKIKTVGEDFDPHTMEAVSTAQGDEGKVVNEVQAGYMLHDRLLRPALVTVGKAKN